MTTPSPSAAPVPEPGTPLPPGVQVPRQRAESPSLNPACASASDNIGGAFALVTMLGGILVVIGSFMPWLTIMAPLVGALSRSGLDGGGDGVFTRVVGIAAVGVGIARFATPLRSLVQRAPILLGALALGIAVLDLANVNDKISSVGSSPYVHAYVGSGLYLLMVGALVTVVGGLVVTDAGARRPVEAGGR